MQTSRIGQLRRVLRDVLGGRTAIILHLMQEDLADLGTITVDGRHDDMGRTVVA